jgi:hypothetical protein
VFERMGRRFWPPFSGVLVSEAQKGLYQGPPIAKCTSRHDYVPVVALQVAARKTLDSP